MLFYKEIALDFDMIEFVCKSWMEHYNFMLSLPGNSEVEKFFYQEHFNEYKWYDV
jgi:hypothetical protein